MRLSLLFGLALLSTITMNANAQDAVYVVSYIDAAPASRTTVANALRQLATASRKDDGNLRYEILQRTAPQNQFAIVSIWKNQAAYDGHAAAVHSKDFREKNKPHLISAIDDRLHNGMEIAAADAKVAPGAVFVVTHVDVPPPRKDECIVALKALVADSRKEANATRFEVLQQTSRPNHFSVVEVWKSEKAYDDHITAAHTKKFRDQLTPMSGALYDERLYKAL
jgi:quinol monooxygenase YgiN